MQFVGVYHCLLFLLLAQSLLIVNQKDVQGQLGQPGQPGCLVALTQIRILQIQIHAAVNVAVRAGQKVVAVDVVLVTRALLKILRLILMGLLEM